MATKTASQNVSKTTSKFEKHRAYLSENEEVKGYIVLTYKYQNEDNKWVVTCLELGTSTFARTLLAAQNRIHDAVLCHLNTLEDVGERERFFKDNHITLFTGEPSKITKIDIPTNTTGFYQSVVLQIPVSCGAAA